MKLIYVCGKFTGPNAWAIEQNIRAAELIGAEVAKLGAMPLIPHANTRFFFGLEGTTEEFWYAGTMELLRRCDAVITVPGWESSKGALAELKEANARRIPVLDSVMALQMWLAWNLT